MSGRLYGVGVGPGDPELMTRKAWRLIRAARVVAYPAPDCGESFARRIAAEAISPDAREIPMIVPMRPDRFHAQEVYREAAAAIALELELGRDVVALCEGDPFFYGSFMYLFGRLAGHFPVEVVPGVSSMMACAAALKRPLAARNDMVSVIPATLPAGEIGTRLSDADCAAIIKLGRHLPKVRQVIEELGLTDRAAYVAHATLPEEVVAPLAEAPAVSPYFSMILIRKGDDPWLS